VSQWPRVRLGDVLSVRNGFAFSSKLFGSVGLPLIRIRDLKNGLQTETCYSGEFDDRYLVHAGDLLIGMDGEFRCYEWRGEPALLNQRVCRLQDFSSKVDKRFIRYSIDSHLRLIEENTGFATVKHLSSKQIEAIQIGLPPLDEQKRIVAKLDEASEAVAKLDEISIAVDDLGNDLRSVFFRSLLEANTWPLTRLGAIVTVRPPKRESRDRLFELDEVTFLPMEDLPVRGGFVTGTKVRPLGEVYSSYTYFADGDVLLAKITPCFENGKIGIAADLSNGVGFGSSEFMVLRCGPRILSEYLYHFISQPSLIGAGIPNMRGSVGHKRVPQDFIEDLELPLPPLDEQKRIVTQLAKFHASLESVRRIRATRSSALNALQQRLFSSVLRGAA
jgi:type I restriction enzyme S subunit